MTSPLERLTGAGKPLAAEPPDAKEFEGLKRSGLARLKDATNSANALESRFDLAYNAAHALSLATLGLGPEVWRVLDKCHQIRNLGEYEGDLNIDERIVTDLIAACRVVAEELEGLEALNQPPGGKKPR
jgi:hypothetical protein